MDIVLPNNDKQFFIHSQIPSGSPLLAPTTLGDQGDPLEVPQEVPLVVVEAALADFSNNLCYSYSIL